MTVLLDTHTLLWAVIQPELLSPIASRILDDNANKILVSAASAWEISIKVHNRKLPGAETFEQNFLSILNGMGYDILPIDAGIALRAARLPGNHRDIFDRFIAAHSLALDIPIISKDLQLDAFNIRRIW